MSEEPPAEQAVNHHRDYPGCTGALGVLGGLLMVLRGGTDARLVLELTGLSAGDRVVDVGCGPGTAVRHAVRAGSAATGVDPSAEMLRIARAVTRRRDRPEWVRAGAEDLPVPDASATVLWTVRSVHHWRDVPAGLAQAHRVLRPGGRLLALERLVAPGSHGLASHGWTARQTESFAALCRDAGFTDVATDRRPLGRKTAAVVTATRPPSAGPQHTG